ncbi:FMN-binding negative transcriptional regulator [Azospirillum halopraeferens]|uniref:FMN-binding negative transcriptional regulator n=1 Tax=Azospirillum halopraeferens TaxID=34010 RepID=UPI00040B4592|nr:FMN-binding negative transcriptional regulator [Azospirillum halopraeferens]
MHLPAAFREDRTPVLHDAIRAIGLANLVTVGPDGPVATPVPLLLDERDGPRGTLIGHLARANPQWRTAAAGVPALAVFMGPEAYVSPSWYATKRETGKVVPTWNYVAVHAYGPLEVFEDRDSLLAVVTALTDRYEAGRAEPWAVADAPADFVDALLAGIVGVRLRIDRLEGKWKLSQNRPAADVDGVIDGLSGGGEGERRVAAAMRARRPD